MREPKWQSVKVDYPKKLYLWALWVTEKSSGTDFPFFFEKLESRQEQVRKLAIKTATALNKTKKSKHSGMNQAFITPLTFKRNFKLKKEMWADGSVKTGYFQKNTDLLERLKKLEFYDLIVTPVIAGKRKATQDKAGFYWAFIIYKNAEDKEIEMLMRGSSMYVSPEAKNAAIYSLDDMYGYDPKTESIIPNKP